VSFGVFHIKGVSCVGNLDAMPWCRAFLLLPYVAAQSQTILHETFDWPQLHEDEPPRRDTVLFKRRSRLLWCVAPPP